MNATIQARADYRPIHSHTSGTGGRFRIEIVDSDEATEDVTDFEITAEGHSISYEADQENAFVGLLPSTCTFTLICTTAGQVTKLKNIAKAEVGRYGVRILYVSGTQTPSTTYWVGTLLNDQISIADSMPMAVQLTAICDLGHLQNVPYLDSDGDRFTGEATTLQHFKNALSQLRTQWYWAYSFTFLGTDYFLQFLDLTEDFLPNIYERESANNRVFEESKIPHAAFYRGEDSALSCYDVLQGLCTYFNASLFQTNRTAAPRWSFKPFGAYQKYAADDAQLTGARYTYNLAQSYTSPLPLSIQDISNGSTNYIREAGGRFSYARAIKKASRKINYFSEGAELQINLNRDGEFNNPTYETEYTYPLEGESDSRFRFIGRTTVYHDNTTGFSIWQFSDISASGQADFRWHIGRVRVRYRIRLETDGNDLYLKRPLTSTGLVPFYENWGNIPDADLPIYYTGAAPSGDAQWVQDGNQYSYVQMSEPFNVYEEQAIDIPFDIITPSIPDDFTSFKLFVEVQYIRWDFTDVVKGAGWSDAGTPYYLASYTNDGVYTNFRVYPYDSAAPSASETYTAENDTKASEQYTSAEGILTDVESNSQGFTGVRYRRTGGTYQAAGSAPFTSYGETTGVTPSTKLAVQEIARFYRQPRELFEGSVIAKGTTFPDPGTLLQLDTIDYRLLQYTYQAGTNRLQFTAIEIDRDTAGTVAFTSFAGDPFPPPPSGGGNNLRNVARLNTSLAQATEDVVEAYNDAGAANRSGQTGEKVVTIDDNGAFQEVADGTDGQFLTTDGSGGISFASPTLALASISVRVSTQYTSAYYYGSSAYGFNYPIWSGISFNNTQGNPYALQISDDYAHCGILMPYDCARMDVTGSIRNDSSTDNLSVILCKGSRPNGSASNIVLTSLGETAVTITTQDRHYNYKVTGGAVSRGELIFLGVRRTAGTTSTRYVQVTATFHATL